MGSPVQHKKLSRQLKLTTENHRNVHIRHQRDVCCGDYQGEHLAILDEGHQVLEHEGHQMVC
jgi:hypothetical protein